MHWGNRRKREITFLCNVCSGSFERWWWSKMIRCAEMGLVFLKSKAWNDSRVIKVLYISIFCLFDDNELKWWCGVLCLLLFLDTSNTKCSVLPKREKMRLYTNAPKWSRGNLAACSRPSFLSVRHLHQDLHLLKISGQNRLPWVESIILSVTNV